MNYKKYFFWIIRIVAICMIITIIEDIIFIELFHPYYNDPVSESIENWSRYKLFLIYSLPPLLATPILAMVCVLILRTTKKKFFTKHTTRVLITTTFISLISAFLLVSSRLHRVATIDETSRIISMTMENLDLSFISFAFFNWNPYLITTIVLAIITFCFHKFLKLKEENELTV